MDDRASLQIHRRKTRDRSVVLILVGALLLLPPFALASLLEKTIFGLPFPLVYVFVIWILLILGALILARPLAEGDETIDRDETGDREI